MTDFYAVAIHSFQESLDCTERQGRKDSPDWQLANGLLCLVHGLRQDYEAEEGRLKSFARTYRPLAGQHPCSLVSKT